MDQFNKTLDQLKDSSGEIKSNLHILDEIIPIEEQIKYFQYSDYVHADRISQQMDQHIIVDKLFSPNIELEDRRYYLTLLAGFVDVAAYRAIETYHHNPLEPELSNWSAMALIENKVLLDADLSGEQQYFVSTGLGGQDGKLRFFSILASSDRSNLNELQKELLTRELKFAFERNDILLEEMEMKGNYVRIMLLCDLKHDVRQIIKNVILECNELGHFIDTKFILTNLRKIEDVDIEKMLQDTPK